MKSVVNNKFAVFIIILIVVGLFLHYEMGYNLDFFTVSSHRSLRNHRHDRKKRYDHDWRDHHNHHWYHHLFPNDYNNLNSRLRRANEHHDDKHHTPQRLNEYHDHTFETF